MEINGCLETPTVSFEKIEVIKLIFKINKQLINSLIKRHCQSESEMRV